MTVRAVYVLQGTSGSGKSTWARTRSVHHLKLSTDNYLVDPDGVYRFTPERQTEGHKRCLREFTSALLMHSDWGNSPPFDLIVDNTNTRPLFMAPYVALALAYGHKVSILSFRAPVEVCAARNNGRAPLNVVREMAEAIDHFTLPAQWEREGVSYTIVDTSRGAS